MVEGSLDQALRVLKRKLAKEGVLKEWRRRTSTKSRASVASTNASKRSVAAARSSVAGARQFDLPLDTVRAGEICRRTAMKPRHAVALRLGYSWNW